MTWRERIRYRRWRREFWGRIMDIFGDHPAPKGMLRNKRTVCILLKQGERQGYYQ